MPTSAAEPLRAPHRAKRLDLLQACRGAAALAVVLYHLTGISEGLAPTRFAKGLFSFGWAGVDLFFVLSGFIIYYIHADDLGRPDRLRGFAWKRLVRIYPIYLVVTLCALPLYFAGFGEPYKHTPAVIVKSLLLWPQASGQSPVITVGWSLTSEALFYLLFAVGIVVGRALRRALFFGWLAGCFLVTLGCTVHLFEATSLSPALFVLLSERNLEFGLGCYCADLLLRRRLRAYWPLFFCGVAGFLAVGLNESINACALPATVKVLLFGVFASLIVLGASGLDLGRPTPLPRWLLFLGDASYSVYLTHGVLLMGLAAAAKRLDLPQRIGILPCEFLLLALAILFGLALYAYVEQPLLERLRRKPESVLSLMARR